METQTHSRKNCFLEGRISHQLDESASAFDIFEQVINLDILLELLVQQSNFYSQQNERNFLINPVEMKAFIGVNYIMAVNQMLSIPMYCDGDHFVGNVGIQIIFTKTRYQEVLQNFYFADNTKQDKADKDYKTRPIIDHLNESFQVAFSNKPKQSMRKCKGCSSMRQYLKMKPIKWG